MAADPKENVGYSEGKKMPEGFVPKSNTAQNLWTTRALIEGLWKDGVPKFSTLWLGDPDASQHLTRPGSPTALAAIRDSDTHLGLAIEELRKRGVLVKTKYLPGERPRLFHHRTSGALRKIADLIWQRRSEEEVQRDDSVQANTAALGTCSTLREEVI
jgi:hypothetical protein